MAIGTVRTDRRFSNLTIIAAATAVSVTVAVLAYQPNLGTASIDLIIGPAGSVPPSASWRQADRIAANPLAIFLERWTNTAGTAGVNSDH
jgi:cell division protein FtsW (lipid II flippase)